MYKTINGWTKAQMIECITERMLDHKSAAMGVCLYNAPDGNHCAVGSFIPEDAEIHESDTPTDISDCSALAGLMPLEVSGLNRMQMCHDAAFINDTRDPRPRVIAWINKNVTNGDTQ